MQTYTFNVANGTKTYTIEAENFTEAKRILRERMVADGIK
jgi:hypothetical protein